jgi:hypothetical protein
MPVYAGWPARGLLELAHLADVHAWLNSWCGLVHRFNVVQLRYNRPCIRVFIALACACGVCNCMQLAHDSSVPCS